MTLLADPSLGLLIDVVRGLVFALFIVCALVLMFIVLLQEGKGGGLGSAFGGAAADAFGVKSGTVSRFTMWIAVGFLGFALLHAGLSSSSEKRSMVPTAPGPAEIEAPADAAPDAASSEEGAPAEDASEQPAPPADEGSAPSDGDAGEGDAEDGGSKDGDAGDGDAEDDG